MSAATATEPASGVTEPVGKAVTDSVHKGVSDSVRTFVAGHGGSATAVLQPVGRIGVRVTLVGADGVLGDRVVADLAAAQALVEAVDGLDAAEHWDRELSAKATPARGHWTRMAGWVARQRRFPKARNEH